TPIAGQVGVFALEAGCFIICCRQPVLANQHLQSRSAEAAGCRPAMTARLPAPTPSKAPAAMRMSIGRRRSLPMTPGRGVGRTDNDGRLGVKTLHHGDLA